MTDLTLDRKTHDLEVTGYSLSLVSGVDLVRQRIKQRLLAIEGEWLLDTTIGLPWFEEIIGKGSEEQQISALLLRQITETEGVEDVLEFDLSLNRNTRQMRVSFRVTASGAEITEEITL